MDFKDVPQIFGDNFAIWIHLEVGKNHALAVLGDTTWLTASSSAPLVARWGFRGPKHVAPICPRPVDLEHLRVLE